MDELDSIAPLTKLRGRKACGISGCWLWWWILLSQFERHGYWCCNIQCHWITLRPSPFSIAELGMFLMKTESRRNR
jgi:hypothetical protein